MGLIGQSGKEQSQLWNSVLQEEQST